MAGYDPSANVCPNCGCQGKCIPFGTYERNVLDYDWEQKEVVESRIKVTRVLCESCSTEEHRITHAILTDAIVPYSPYSLFFILTVLYYRLCLGKKLMDICQRFQIPPVQYYRWEKLLKQHMREWLGILESLEQRPKQFLEGLVTKANYSMEFSDPFLRLTTRSFMQSHSNPANCRYPKFGPP